MCVILQVLYNMQNFYKKNSKAFILIFKKLTAPLMQKQVSSNKVLQCICAKIYVFGKYQNWLFSWS